MLLSLRMYTLIIYEAFPNYKENLKTNNFVDEISFVLNVEKYGNLDCVSFFFISTTLNWHSINFRIKSLHKKWYNNNEKNNNNREDDLKLIKSFLLFQWKKEEILFEKSSYKNSYTKNQHPALVWGEDPQRMKRDKKVWLQIFTLSILQCLFSCFFFEMKEKLILTKNNLRVNWWCECVIEKFKLLVLFFVYVLIGGYLFAKRKKS